MLYQGVWWLQHTVKSAFQPLVIIHFIHIRCYETDVADIVLHTALISLAVYEKGRENKKTSLQVTKYEAYSRTQRFPWVPTNQA